MPIYEYRCTSCRHTFEVIQKFTDAPIATCANCSGPLEKLISRTSFHLKGGGWFINDYGAPAAKDSAGNEKKEKKDGKESKGSEAASGTSKGSCGSGGCGCAG